MSTSFDPVYVPCELTGLWFDSSVIVRDADGREIRMLAGRLEIVDSMLCLVALRLEQRDDLSLVRFRDGSECWLRPVVTRHTPDRVDPIRVETALRMLSMAA